jgi:alpha-D-ribose 1-methylphosphonate 5-triphosphate synthase subunit PhnI
MAYVAVKGGEQAIRNSHQLLHEERRGDTVVPELSLAQVEQQLGLAVDRVMTEGSLYDRELAALALKQAQGDAVEAIFLLRAFRTTLPRLAVSEPIETAAMDAVRRISTTFKDVPGGQVLGATYDYTHRLLDFALVGEAEDRQAPQADAPDVAGHTSIFELFGADGLVEQEQPVAGEPYDLTRQSMNFPAGRDQRLQNLVRGDEGFLLGLAYSTGRGYGGAHPFVGELKFGSVTVQIVPEELGFPIEVAEIEVTECQMLGLAMGSEETPAQFTRGYGLTFGHCERKAMSMAIVDRSLRSREFGERVRFPAQTEEFVLSHTDSVEASGFVTHIKMPHYVDFQSELQLARQLRGTAGGDAE